MDQENRLLKVSRYTMGSYAPGLALAREFLRATLYPFKGAEPYVDDMVSAAHEACKNAVEHNPETAHPVEITCQVFSGSMVVEVSDRGAGFNPGPLPPQPPGPESPAGRGLLMLYSLVDEVDLDTGAGGTRVRMLKRF